MPAESKKQQRFFGQVHAVQKGELSPSEVGPAVRKAARNTDYSDAKDIASTKHKNLPEKKGSVQMKYFEKIALTANEKATIANRAVREGNLILSSPEYRKDWEKQEKKKPVDSHKQFAKDAPAGLRYGAGAGAVLGGVTAISHKVKGVKPLAKMLGKYTAGGAVAGGFLGANIGLAKDFYSNMEQLDKNVKKVHTGYLAKKNIGVSYNRFGRPEYTPSTKAVGKYFTNYDRKKIKAQRILKEK
jgi:uncharacterized protein YcfJ